MRNMYIYVQFFETGGHSRKSPLSWLFCRCLEIKHRIQIDECRFGCPQQPAHDLWGNFVIFLPLALSSQVSELSGRWVGQLQNLQGPVSVLKSGMGPVNKWSRDSWVTTNKIHLLSSRRINQALHKENLYATRSLNPAFLVTSSKLQLLHPSFF